MAVNKNISTLNFATFKKYQNVASFVPVAFFA